MRLWKCRGETAGNLLVFNPVLGNLNLRIIGVGVFSPCFCFFHGGIRCLESSKMVFINPNPAQIDLLVKVESTVPAVSQYFTALKAVQSDSLRTPEEIAVASLVPAATLRAAAKAAGISFRQLFEMVTTSDHKLPSKEEGGKTSSNGWVIAPHVLPPNPHRASMRRRVKEIDALAEEVEYQTLVQGKSNVTTVQQLVNDSSPEGRHRRAQGEKESFGKFMRDMGIGLDVRLMSIAGGVVGYYLCYVRGMAREECIVGGAIGAVLMMFVDGVLLIIKMGKDDRREREEKARRKEFRPSSLGAESTTATAPMQPIARAAAVAKKQQ